VHFSDTLPESFHDYLPTLVCDEIEVILRHGEDHGEDQEGDLVADDDSEDFDDEVADEVERVTRRCTQSQVGFSKTALHFLSNSLSIRNSL